MKLVENYINLLTLVAVVAGLGLVVWELQQVKTLSRAQLSSDYAVELNAVHQLVVGESLSGALAKACEMPKELTLEEALIVRNYYSASLNLVVRMYLLSERDGLYPSDYWRSQLHLLLPIASSRYGRAWLSTVGGGEFMPGIIEASRAYMDEIDPDHCMKRHQELLRHVDA